MHLYGFDYLPSNGGMTLAFKVKVIAYGSLKLKK